MFGQAFNNTFFPENLCDISSSASQSDDFASLHSTGNLRNGRPVIKPPQGTITGFFAHFQRFIFAGFLVPIEVKSERKINSGSGGFSSLHGGRATPNSLGTTDSDPSTDISVIKSLQVNIFWDRPLWPSMIKTAYPGLIRIIFF